MPADAGTPRQAEAARRRPVSEDSDRLSRGGATAGTGGASRLPALDGLRGVAALVVLVFHVLLLSDTFADSAPGVRPHEPSWWLTHTPLSLLWAGEEAVFVFFVLSGFVLTLPATVAPVRWRAYSPQRLVRLHLPVWASLLLPVYLVLARWRPSLWPLKGLGLLAIVAAAPVLGRPELTVLSIFGFGVLLAHERDRLATVARSIGPARRAGCSLQPACC